MPFEFICPRCDNPVTLRETYRGLSLRCPQCSEPIRWESIPEEPILLESVEPEPLPILPVSSDEPPIILESVEEAQSESIAEDPVILESIPEEMPILESDSEENPPILESAVPEPVPVFQPIPEPPRPPSFEVLLPRGWRSHRRFLMYYSPEEMTLVYLTNHPKRPELVERMQKRGAERRRKIEQISWLKLPEENRLNLRIVLDEILVAYLGPPSFWYRFKYRPRSPVALLRLQSRTLGTIQIELLEEKQVSILREMLPNTLGKRLRVDRSLAPRSNPLLS